MTFIASLLIGLLIISLAVGCFLITYYSMAPR